MKVVCLFTFLSIQKPKIDLHAFCYVFCFVLSISSSFFSKANMHLIILIFFKNNFKFYFFFLIYPFISSSLLSLSPIVSELEQ